MTDQFPNSRDSVTEIEGKNETQSVTLLDQRRQEKDRRSFVPSVDVVADSTHPVMMVGPNARMSPTQLRIDVSVKVLTVP